MITYEPDIELAKLAPAAVCNIACKIVWLRQLIEKEPNLFNPYQIQRLKPFIGEFSFEKELLSGKQEQVYYWFLDYY